MQVQPSPSGGLLISCGTRLVRGLPGCAHVACFMTGLHGPGGEGVAASAIDMQDGEYECTVLATHLEATRFEVQDSFPAVGVLERLSQQHWFSKGTALSQEGGQCLAGNFAYPVVVRALSKEDLSASVPFVPLINQAYFVSFLLGWVEAKEAARAPDATASSKALARSFAIRARSVRVRFVYLPTADAVQQKKWQLQESVSELGDAVQFNWGYKRVLALAEVQSTLKERNLPHDHNAVAKWFKSVKFASSTEAVTQRTAARDLRIYERLGQDRQTVFWLEIGEAHFGRQWPLAYVTTLAEVCAKTALGQKEQAALEQKLVQWVVGGITVHCLRGSLARDTPRDIVSKQIVPVLLLVRRVVVYLANRFPFVNEEGKEYAAGRSPRVVISTVFANWQAFHEAYPKGAKATVLLPEALSQEEPAASSQEAARSCSTASTFAACLPGPQQKIIELLRSLLDFRPDIKGLLWNSIQKDVNMTGEVFMGQQEFKGDGVFDFEELVQDGAGLGYEFGVALDPPPPSCSSFSFLVPCGLPPLFPDVSGTTGAAGRRVLGGRQGQGRKGVWGFALLLIGNFGW